MARRANCDVGADIFLESGGENTSETTYRYFLGPDPIPTTWTLFLEGKTARPAFEGAQKGSKTVTLGDVNLAAETSKG